MSVSTKNLLKFQEKLPKSDKASTKFYKCVFFSFHSKFQWEHITKGAWSGHYPVGVQFSQTLYNDWALSQQSRFSCQSFLRVLSSQSYTHNKA